MLQNLYIKNFVLIKELNIDFNEGFNIISGETGAGKSILLNAISMLKGNRFNKQFIGRFDDETIIEGVFDMTEDIKSILIKNDYETDFENIIITRKFSEKTSVTKLNNRVISLYLLNEISDKLFDIHGQHSQLVVLNKSNYIEIIDSFNDKIVEIKSKIKDNLIRKSVILKELNEIDISDEETQREIDILQFQISEIEEFDFDSYNEEEINREYKKLTNQASIIEVTSKILYLINDSGNGSLKDIINSINQLMYELTEYDSKFEDFNSDIVNIKELTYDFSRALENYSYTLNIDEERIKIIESDFQKLQSLKRKYGRNIFDIIKFYDESKLRLKKLSDVENLRKSLNEQIKSLENVNLKLADELTALRLEIIKFLEKRIINELAEMNMEYIDFKILLTKMEKVTESGNDFIDFLISTNKGQELKSLSAVSSGGEVSRFMLALKASLAEKEDVQTIIFDEIDTGISGKTANIVGEKLKKISYLRQLIVITHLPQIASQADFHFLIRKETIDENTISNIVKLDEDQRVNEIARLISGADITEKSKISAKELISMNAKGL